MTSRELKQAHRAAQEAARAAGALMRKHARGPKKVNFASQHDLKLELDVRSQKLIERILARAAPDVPVLGEEGITGDPGAPARWVVDPIDGTVNFAYGVPHCCVSIALQIRSRTGTDDYQTEAGVVYDPFCDELWTARRGEPSRLNGNIIAVSGRSRLQEAIVSVGFAKQASSLEAMLPAFNQLIHRVRKVRIMGSAALALVYVASGRFDLYLETGLRLWDIAAGGLIIESAGGEFWRRPLAGGRYSYEIIASNGRLRQKLPRRA